MAEIIWSGNRDQYLVEIDQMHERRWRICFEQLGWDAEAAGVERGYDRDAFDTNDTLYIIQRHPSSGDIIASARLNPTLKPHMMSDVFPHFCDFPGGVPRAADIYEVSRLLFDIELAGDRDTFRRARATMRVALTEFCMRSGIRAFDFVVRDKLFTEMMRNLWSVQPLGSYHPDRKLPETYVAGLAAIDQAGLDRLRKQLGHDRPVLFYNGPVTDFILPRFAEAA
ncbi:MAG: acyl-homoserine-lactone synthase [Henriciella sp.]|nr:acyl-homoserine-lactone synthase [Henriciella sp.]